MDENTRFSTIGILRRREVFERLLGAGLVAATPAFALAPASPVEAADLFGFGSDFTRNWVPHSASSAGRATKITGGVRLETGAVGQNSHGVAIWSRATLGSSWTAKFRFKRLDGVTAPSQLIFTLFYFGVTGGGSSPTDLGAWSPKTTPYTHDYAPRIKGARLAFARTDPKDATAARQVTAAYFAASGLGTALKAGKPVFDFPTGVTCAVTITRKGSRVTFASQPTGGKKSSQSFSSAAFTTHAGAGHFGFLCAPGRACEITSLSIKAG